MADSPTLRGQTPSSPYVWSAPPTSGVRTGWSARAVTEIPYTRHAKKHEQVVLRITPPRKRITPLNQEAPDMPGPLVMAVRQSVALPTNHHKVARAVGVIAIRAGFLPFAITDRRRWLPGIRGTKCAAGSPGGWENRRSRCSWMGWRNYRKPRARSRNYCLRRASP
jgi:hypothetical protein